MSVNIWMALTDRSFNEQFNLKDPFRAWSRSMQCRKYELYWTERNSCILYHIRYYLYRSKALTFSVCCCGEFVQICRKNLMKRLINFQWDRQNRVACFYLADLNTMTKSTLEGSHFKHYLMPWLERVRYMEDTKKLLLYVNIPEKSNKCLSRHWKLFFLFFFCHTEKKHSLHKTLVHKKYTH